MPEDKPRDYTRKEQMVTFISHEMKDDDIVAFPAGIPELRAGVFLANLTHAPNLRIHTTMSGVNVLKEFRLESFDSAMDWRFSRFIEGYFLHHEVFDMASKAMDVFFVGGIQIDKFGNTNLIGIGDNYEKLRFRGPGSLGAASVSTLASRYYIFTNTHSKRVFVEKCDFISTFGWGTGGADAREKLGLPGGGPKYIITPLCIMDFEDQTKALRLKYLHQGISKEDVINNTGFPVIVPQEIQSTPLPTGEEMELLRTRIDIDGALRS